MSKKEKSLHEFVEIVLSAMNNYNSEEEQENVETCDCLEKITTEELFVELFSRVGLSGMSDWIETTEQRILFGSRTKEED